MGCHAAGYLSWTRFQTLIGTVKGKPPKSPTRRASKFQTLIGTVKGCVLVGETVLLLLFQTLIGTVKGVALSKLEDGEVRVSNPHRYGQREVRQEGAYVMARFQTLIGTVKGQGALHQVLGHSRFQTLIGTVKGGDLVPGGREGNLVSNPHRYGQRKANEQRLAKLH